jgi:hypothetical protein
MDGTPPALPTDSEDVVWALQTAESLWKRGERVDAVVWIRRAAQAAGEGEDTRRAARLARYAADLGDWIASNSIAGPVSQVRAQSAPSYQSLDALLDFEPLHEEHALSSRDVEVMSARDFEAGFSARSERPQGPTSEGEVMTVSLHAPDVEILHSEPARGATSEGEVMTVSLHAPDVELLDDDDEDVEQVDESELSDGESFPEEEPTPVRHVKSPAPPAEVPTAEQAHAGMLDPWKDSALSAQKKGPARREPSSGGFGDDEVVTSAQARSEAQPPPAMNVTARVPGAPRTPGFPIPVPRPRPLGPASPPTSAIPEDEEATTYRQINRRASNPPDSAPPLSARTKPPAAPPRDPSRDAKPAAVLPRPKAPVMEPRPRAPVIEARPAVPAPKVAPRTHAEPELRRAPPPSIDLLDLADSLAPPTPSAAPTPSPPRSSQVSESARPTAPPPSGVPLDALPSGLPTSSSRGVSSSLDLEAVEALGDLPDDAREAFARAARLHAITVEEEVSHFALALVIDGDIDVSATIVDVPAVKLTKNAVVRSRGTLVPGIALRLVCSSAKATVATWDEAAVSAAFRPCPWVEEDLRSVADRVQASAGVTMGPLGERFDISLREHVTSRLTLRTLAPGEVLIAQGKPVGILIVGIGDVTLTNKAGERTGTARPGDFVFPTQTLGHGAAPETATAGGGGAVVLVGDRATAQDLLMTLPPLLEVLAML